MSAEILQGHVLRCWVCLIGLVIATAGCGSSPEDEADAVAKLKEFGVLVVPDSDGLVTSVNFLSIKDRENAREALALVGLLADPDSLNLESMPLTDDDLVAVSKMKSLKELVANETDISDRGAQHLGELSKLSTLYLNRTNISNKALPAIGQLSNLVILDLSNTQISSDLVPLKDLENLNWILLRNVELPDEAFQTLAALPKLGRLNMEGASFSEEAVSRLKSARPDLIVEADSAPSAAYAGEGAGGGN